MWQGARVGPKAVAVGQGLGSDLQVKWMRVRLPGHCVGGGGHYRLTVTVTSSNTLRLHSGELHGGQMMGCAKVVWTFYVCCFVLF